MNAVIVVAAIVVVVIALSVLSRASGRKKRHAQEDLKREKEEIGRFDILDLVRAELEETGAGDIAGGEDLDPTVLLRVWRRDEKVRDGCSDASLLRFVVDDGVALQDVDADSVRLMCSNEGPAVTTDDDREAVDSEPSEIGGAVDAETDASPES